MARGGLGFPFSTKFPWSPGLLWLTTQSGPALVIVGHEQVQVFWLCHNAVTVMASISRVASRLLATPPNNDSVRFT